MLLLKAGTTTSIVVCLCGNVTVVVTANAEHFNHTNAHVTLTCTCVCIVLVHVNVIMCLSESRNCSCIILSLYKSTLQSPVCSVMHSYVYSCILSNLMGFMLLKKMFENLVYRCGQNCGYMFIIINSAVLFFLVVVGKLRCYFLFAVF